MSKAPATVSQRRLPSSSVSTPWMCVIVNTLAFPGLGSVMARRMVGFAQIAVTLLGFAVFVGFMLWYFAGLLRAAADYTADLEAFQQLAKSHLWIAGAGVGLVFLAWVWAAFTSMSILRVAREQRGPPPVPLMP